jgi:undecaprenyl-diphosphatase
MDKVVAEWIGAHVIEFLLILSLLTLLLIFLLWRAIEIYGDDLWRLGNRFWSYFKGLSYVQRFHGRYPEVWQFVQGRLSPLGYLELYLAIGLIVGGFAFALFGNIAVAVMEQEEIVRFDQMLATSLHENYTPTEVSFFNFITFFGGRTATIFIGVGTAIAFVIRRRRLLLLSWAAALLGNSLLNAVLKAFFQRGRPEFSNPLLVETNWSFPSGHAMGSIVLYGMLTYLLILSFKQQISKFIVTVMVVLILLIGFSRLYLGAHYFSDVMAGYVAGLGWLAIVISGTEIARRHNWRRAASGTLLKADNEAVPT